MKYSRGSTSVDPGIFGEEGRCSRSISIEASESISGNGRSSKNSFGLSPILEGPEGSDSAGEKGSESSVITRISGEGDRGVVGPEEGDW